MRKDVRLGFSVGGLLLAVIIVAVLVIHRGKNPDKSVALDKGTGQSANDTGPIDVGSKPAPDTAADPNSAGPRSDQKDTAAAEGSGTSGQPDAAGKSGGQWDALFQSTASDPIQAQLTSPPARPRADRAASPRADRTDDTSGNSGTGAGAETHRAIEAAAPARNETASDSPRTHKLQPGETFMSISKSVYGNSRYFKAIQAANPTLSPEKLKPGTIIQLPPASQVKQAAKPAKPAAPAGVSEPIASSNAKTYTVQKDDSLYKIARKLYGKGDRSGELYTLNQSVIGPDSTRLKIGMVLALPEAPSTAAGH